MFSGSTRASVLVLNAIWSTNRSPGASAERQVRNQGPRTVEIRRTARFHISQPRVEHCSRGRRCGHCWHQLRRGSATTSVCTIGRERGAAAPRVRERNADMRLSRVAAFDTGMGIASAEDGPPGLDSAVLSRAYGTMRRRPARTRSTGLARKAGRGCPIRLGRACAIGRSMDRSHGAALIERTCGRMCIEDEATRSRGDPRSKRIRTMELR